MKNLFKMLGLVGLMTLASCGENTISKKDLGDCLSGKVEACEVEVETPTVEEVIEIDNTFTRIEALEDGTELTVGRSDVPGTRMTYELVITEDGPELQHTNAEGNISVILVVKSATELGVWLPNRNNGFSEYTVDTISLDENGNTHISRNDGKTWNIRLGTGESL